MKASAITVPAGYLFDFWSFIGVDRSNPAPKPGVPNQAGAGLVLVAAARKPGGLDGNDGFRLIEVLGIATGVKTAGKLIGNRFG